MQQNTLGNIDYEITNYPPKVGRSLGNLNVVISDRKIWNTSASAFKAVSRNYTDYYPFACPPFWRRMEISSRTSVGTYRYGYNGMEQDPEAKGEGNSYTTEFRQYDPRLGRWLSLDPLMAMFPWQSPYCAFDNNPIYFTDPLGLAAEGGKDKKGEPELNKDLPEVKYVHKRTPLEKLKGLINSLKRDLNINSANKAEKKKESNPKTVLLGGGDLFATGEMGINDQIANALDSYIQKNNVSAEKGDIVVFDSPMWAKSNSHKEIIKPIVDKIEEMSKKGGPVILYGYSFGGHLLSWVVEELDKRNVNIDVLITVDQASGPGTMLEDRKLPKNVLCNINFYQQNYF